MDKNHFVEVKCESGYSYNAGPMTEDAAKKKLIEERERLCGKDCLIRRYTKGKG